MPVQRSLSALQPRMRAPKERTVLRTACISFFIVVVVFTCQCALRRGVPLASSAVEARPAAQGMFESFATGDFTHNVPSGEAWNLGVCALTLDEGPYLEEWVLYHAALGVDQFFIYDQGNDTATEDALAPFIAAGLVTFHRVSAQSREFMYQALLLRKCYDDYGPRIRWLGHWDIDEYIVVLPRPFEAPPWQAADNWRESPTVLGRILSEYSIRSAGAVQMSRYNYINCGVEKLAPNQTVMSSHLHRNHLPAVGSNDAAEEAYRYTKSIARTNFKGDSVAVVDAHSVKLRLPYELQNLATLDKLYVNFEGEGLLPSTTKTGTYLGKMNATYDRVYLNHYMQRDLEDCWTKADRRIACCPLSWRAVAGRAWCENPGVFVSPGVVQPWVAKSLKYDPTGAHSHIGVAVQKILQDWRQVPGAHSWVLPSQWQKVWATSKERTINIKYVLSCGSIQFNWV